MLSQKRANSSAISQVKEGLYLDPKPFPRRTHWRRNAEMFKTKMTSQSSLSSIPSIELRGHFRNVFVKPSTVFVLFRISFLKMFSFVALKWLKNKMSKFWFIWPLSYQSTIPLVHRMHHLLGSTSKAFQTHSKTFPVPNINEHFHKTLKTYRRV